MNPPRVRASIKTSPIVTGWVLKAPELSLPERLRLVEIAHLALLNPRLVLTVLHATVVRARQEGCGQAPRTRRQSSKQTSTRLQMVCCCSDCAQCTSSRFKQSWTVQFARIPSSSVHPDQGMCACKKCQQQGLAMPVAVCRLFWSCCACTKRKLYM